MGMDVVMKKLASCILTIALILPCIAYASSVVEVNIGEVPTEQTQRPERAAFAQVLVKMTGSKESLKNDTVRSQMRNASSFLSSYAYFDQNQQQFYRGVFDREKVEQLIRSANLPLWGPRRPDAILWLVDQNNNNIQLVSDAEGSTLRRAIHTSSRLRGVKVLLPLLDLDDAMNLTEYDVWGRFMPALVNASQRYSTDYIIAARIQSTDNLSQRYELASARFDATTQVAKPFRDLAAFSYDISDVDTFLALTLQQGEAQQSFEAEEFAINSEATKYQFVLDWSIKGEGNVVSGQFYANSRAELIAKLLDHYADDLGQQYAIPSGERVDALTLSIANVQSLTNMVELTRYLSDLTVVQSLQLQQLKGSVAIFSVSLLGNEMDLQNTLLLDEKISQLSRDSVPLRNNENMTLHLFWNDN